MLRKTGDKNLGRLKLRKGTSNIGKWNVQSFRNKIVEIIKEVDTMELDLIILTGIKKIGTGNETLGNYIHL